MAIGWLTVLKMVPWTDVISNAPVIADGAKKLWKAAAKKTPPIAPATQEGPATLLPESSATAVLQAQLASVEATVATLHQQMLASSELITALADQNAQLIKRIEVMRVRLWCLVGAMAALCVLVVINLDLLPVG